MPLHEGSVPRWLWVRMTSLAEGIFTIMVEEVGVKGVLEKLSDPLFFQALSNVLGFDWDSSGSTTVTCGVLREVFDKCRLGVKVAGGKGERSRKTLDEVEVFGEELNLPEWKIEELKYASRMVAKVDNTAIQAGYQLYHHSFFIAENGLWAVIQQGLNAQTLTARRYHWFSCKVKSFVEEPHQGFCGQMVHENVLNMVAAESRESRMVCVDILNEHPSKVRRCWITILKPNQTFLTDENNNLKVKLKSFNYRLIPENVNWKALYKAYEVKPRGFEEVLAVKGIGPSTIKALALISELIYDAKPSWEDPLKFSFAFGGKDGIPYPIKKVVMDKAIRFLREILEACEVEKKEKLEALKRLKNFAPKTLNYFAYVQQKDYLENVNKL
ncbi:MAG: DUF763 domain-containing protein [Candidatus Bathyarchaeota archaeon]